MVILMRKTVLITGGSRGLGASIGRIFAQNGYNIIINYKSSDNLAKKLKEELKEKVFRANLKLFEYGKK